MIQIERLPNYTPFDQQNNHLSTVTFISTKNKTKINNSNLVQNIFQSENNKNLIYVENDSGQNFQ